MKNAMLHQHELNPLDFIRHSTHTQHKALEKRLNFPHSFKTKASFARVLSLFHVFQSELTEYAAHFRDRVVSEFELDKRCRLSLLEQDMALLGMPQHAEQVTASHLELSTLDAFYGALYVSEGSTLGGHLIQTAMLKIHGEEARQWTHYLNPYGEQMIPMWSQFKAVLEAEINAGRVDVDNVVRGAGDSFQYLLDIAQELGFGDGE